jgi:ABC-type multidrug transport system ATPase subunit
MHGENTVVLNAEALANQEINENACSQISNNHVSTLNTLRAGDKAHFGWSDVSFKLSAKAVGKSKKDPWVLKNLKGAAIPGEVVAIMGASGCGKTSLLNVLSGRVVSMNGHEVKGNFSINGNSVKPEKLGAKVAFVTQEDALCPTATPREALDFSARLRLPPSVTDEERKQMVNEAIEVLRLERCADSMIGNEMIKGISGGEKR